MPLELRGVVIQTGVYLMDHQTDVGGLRDNKPYDLAGIAANDPPVLLKRLGISDSDDATG